MTAVEQDAKYAPGTIIEITGQPIAAENGRFQLEDPFPVQPNGDQYFQWSRLGKNDQPLKGKSTANLRGKRFSWLEENAKIVSPTLTPALARDGLRIICKTSPEWGTWTLRFEDGFWTRRGRSGVAVIDPGEFHFWRLADEAKSDTLTS